MASVVQPIIEPDVEAIGAHLAALFTPCVSEYPRGLVEIAHGADGRLTSANLFPITKQGMAEAVAYAVEQNRRGENVYVGVNPRKPGTQDNKRASAKDVEIAFFHFADLDQEEQVTLARHRMPIKPGMVVMTGTKPSNRPHLYWQLEEPVGNLTEWSSRQRGIAQTLGGDMVIDPPRIMRLAGTVNYPTQDKLSKRGYAVELVTLKTEFADERAPVTPEQIAAAFPAQQQELAPTVSNLETVPGQTTLAAMSRGTRVADLINACRSGDEWHNSMVRLVAHLASTGRADAEILGLAAGITLPGYTIEQTLKEMVHALRSARQKWNIPEPEDTVETEEASREAADSTFELLDLDELESLPPPTWLIEGLITDHGLSIIYGDPGSYKSFIALDASLRLAFGMDWHGTETKRAGVLYIAGEGARGLGKRVKGWRREHGLEGAEAPFLLLPVPVQMLDAKERAKLCRTIDAAKARAGFDISLIIIDTVSRSIAGQDENGQEAMSLFVSACGEIQIYAGGAVIGVHHAGKDSSRGMRGSSVLLGGCDASLKITKDEGQRVTIEVEKQKDAEEAAPIYMTMKKVEWQVGLGKPENTLIPEKSERATSDEKTISKHQADQIFEMIETAWSEGHPWSPYPHAKRSGRFLPSQIADEFGVTQFKAEEHLRLWQQRGYLTLERFSKRSEAKGLKVVKYLERDE